jgi:hypothetical protein
MGSFHLRFLGSKKKQNMYIRHTCMYILTLFISSKSSFMAMSVLFIVGVLSVMHHANYVRHVCMYVCMYACLVRRRAICNAPCELCYNLVAMEEKMFLFAHKYIHICPKRSVTHHANYVNYDLCK